MTELPIVDLGDPGAVAALDRACREFGFFRLVGHGVTDDDGDAVIDAARAVLATPDIEVRTMLVADDPNFRGFEMAGERLAFEIGREGEGNGRHLVGPNRWPDIVGVESARVVLDHHFEVCTSIADRVLELLVLAGRLGPEFVGQAIRGGPAHLRVWRYPPGHIELPAHADHGFLTLLIAPEAGLEVEAPDGSFVLAPAASGEEILVNVGRLLTYASNDVYRPTVHRVVSDSGSERFSVPFFYAPADHLEIAPPNAASTEPRTVGEYIKWGYTWQHQVNAGATVAEATGGAIER